MVVHQLGRQCMSIYIYIYIYGAESSTDYIINIFSVTTKDNFGSSQATFVRKGMKIKAIKVDTS